MVTKINIGSESGAAPPAGDVTPPPAAAPLPILTQDDVMRIVQQTMAPMTESLSALTAALRQSQPTSTVEDAEPTLAEDDVQSAFTENRLASVVNRFVERKLAHRLKRFEDESVAPLRTTGLARIAELALQVNRGKMKRLSEPEIEKTFNQMVAGLGEAAGNPKALEIAYHAAVGAHAEAIIEREKTAALKTAAQDEGGEALTGGSGSRKTAGTEEGRFTPERLVQMGVLPADAIHILEDRGGPEEFARSLTRGRQGWKEYSEKIVKHSGFRVEEEVES